MTPLFYSRSTIAITRHQLGAPDPGALPWQPVNPTVEFAVEVRDAASYYNQKDWFSLSGLSDKKGVMVLFGAPTISALMSSTQFAPLDVLMIDKHGTIIQIVPNIVLAKLEKEIYPQDKVLAFLFLKGGSCAALSITPGDSVAYEKLFKKTPEVLSLPPGSGKSGK